MSTTTLGHSGMNFPPLETCTVAVIGLGYVGLPLAVEFAKPQACARTGAPLRRRVIGFDINQQRLEELRVGHDRTNETTAEELQAAELLEFTTESAALAQADVFVVTVPTPIDSAKRPDLSPLEQASAAVGRALQARAAQGTTTLPLVIYESTVYPGATEEVCVPILEKESRLRFNEGFYCGYSPERINPGDTEHKLTTITKVTSGSTTEAAAWVDHFYGSIIRAGTHQAASLKVAEAAKVIENTQRDLNIALVNELAIIFRQLGIDTLDVLEAAGSKWNFMPFRPGLVGGHCIGVDPYYLTHKAEQMGYHPQVVLAGRRINDGMGRWVVEQLVLEMARRGMVIAGAKVLVLGITFKENCPDLRNTRVVDVIEAMQRYGIKPVLVDPWVDLEEAEREYSFRVLHEIPSGQCWNAVVAAVAHHQFTALESERWYKLLAPNGVLYDLKGIAPKELCPLRL
jgi:UDP-N-acetyl-D-galactosamine dehydrogenase